ncbi:MAG TPA: hypothetical protein VFP61_03230 [Acidimicrobiales bacterium]|nr:hypothetical protein [Acidimicrobiales bacterium]
MELAGVWRAAPADDLGRRTFPDPALDDARWATVEVPGSWRCWPGFETCDGPVFHRHRFAAAAPGPGRRAWLRFEGLAYQGDVWLDGSYLGDTEGYFAPHTFEVTEALRAADEHLLAVEVACAPAGATPPRALTGALTDPAWVGLGWNPGGIWAPVRLVETGAVRIGATRISCPDASAEAATLHLDVALHAADAATVPLSVVVRDEAGHEVGRRDGDEAVAVGVNRVRRRVRIERPELWWPHAMGDQPLHTVELVVGDGRGAPSDRRRVTTGLRQVRMRGFVATVNGERLHLKGLTYGPAGRAPGAVAPAVVRADVAAAVGAGVDLLRVRAHVAHPALYAAADAAGLLLWQDLPISANDAGLRRQAVRQARQAVGALGHHPSIAIWCGHDEPVPAGPPGSLLRRAARQAVPRPGGARLDRSVRRALERADGSRPVLAASGVLPHPAGGTDAELWPGWRSPDQRDLTDLVRRLPVVARFVSGLSAQSAPDDPAGLPGRWPALDWERLAADGTDVGLVTGLVPTAAHPTYGSWRDATQALQADLVARSVLDLRRLKYRPNGGFTVATMVDAHPAVSAALLDHDRRPKAAWAALTAACAPVVVVADRLPAACRAGERLHVAVHVVSDLRTPIERGEVTAELRWAGGQRRWRFGGAVAPDAVTRVGALDAVVPAVPGTLALHLELRWPGGRATGGDATDVVV